MRKVLVRSGASWFEDDLDNYGSLREFLEIVDDWIGYSQASVTVEDAESEELIAMRQWWECPYDAEKAPEENPVEFGEYGHYGDWQDMSGEKLIDKWE